MKLLDALQWRYAVKKMNGTKVPAEKLETIIEATRLAPSGFGLTPYSIIVVEDRSEEHTSELQSPLIISYAVFLRSEERRVGKECRL